jgi:hypothetical protein
MPARPSDKPSVSKFITRPEEAMLQNVTHGYFLRHYLCNVKEKTHLRDLNIDGWITLLIADRIHLARHGT